MPYHQASSLSFFLLCLLEIGAHYEAEADLGICAPPPCISLPNAQITARHHHASCNRTFLEFLPHYSHLWALPNKTAVLEGGTSPPILSIPTWIGPKAVSGKWDSDQSVAPRERLGCAPDTSSDRSSHAFLHTRLLSKSSRTCRAPGDCPILPFLFCLFCSCWLPLSQTCYRPYHQGAFAHDYLASFTELTSGHLSCWRILSQGSPPGQARY